MTTRLQANATDRRYAILSEMADALRCADLDVSNIQAVIAATRFSLQDIVDEFGSTSHLFNAMVETASTSLLEPLDDCTNELSFQQKLLAFAHRATDAYSAVQLRCLYRIAVTDDIRNAGMGRDFHHYGPGLVADGLTRFFMAAQEAGIGLEEDSRRLASHLMALLRANLDISAPLTSETSNETTSPRDKVSRIIELFCAGIEMEADDAHAVL